MKNLVLIIATVFVFGVTNTIFPQIAFSKPLAGHSGKDTDKATHNLTVNVPLFALVDIEDNGKAIELSPGVSDEAGMPLDFNAASAKNSTAYLNYTSVVGSNSGNTSSNSIRGQHFAAGSSNISSRKVTAKINKALDGTGVSLQIEASAYAGNGAGLLGSSEGPKVLKSSQALTIVSGIGSCYTGDGENNGHLLTYSLVQAKHNNAVNYRSLTSGSYNVEITYTITD